MVKKSDNEKKTQEEIEINERAVRKYESSILPMFKEGTESSIHQDILLVLYGEICSAWRTLTDVRFKLLGLIPTVSVVVLINILSRDDPPKGLSSTARTGIIVFGFLVTFALYIYDRRNSQFYDDLISRGRRIEEELGIDTGQFRGRLKPSNWLIQHDVATNLIYGTALAGWLFALLATWLGWIK